MEILGILRRELCL